MEWKKTLQSGTPQSVEVEIDEGVTGQVEIISLNLAR